MLALFVPRLTQVLVNDSSAPSNSQSYNVGQSRLLGIFTGFNVLSLILIFFFVPETAGASLGQDESNHLNFISLEELNYIFGVTTRKHIDYQVREVLPWALRMFRWKWKRHILRRGDEKNPPPASLKDSYTWVLYQEASEELEEMGSDRSESN